METHNRCRDKAGRRTICIGTLLPIQMMRPAPPPIPAGKRRLLCGSHVSGAAIVAGMNKKGASVASVALLKHSDDGVAGASLIVDRFGGNLGWFAFEASDLADLDLQCKCITSVCKTTQGRGDGQDG
jgi:hypothetical protein